jgi:hypothetical protein
LIVVLGLIQSWARAAPDLWQAGSRLLMIWGKGYSSLLMTWASLIYRLGKLEQA